MAMLLSGTVILCVVTAVALGAPAGHTHPDKVESEKWVLTVVLKSGEPDNPTWEITDKDRAIDNTTDTIARAIDHYVHQNSKLPLASVGGYQGFIIDHVMNGNSTGVDTLPKCHNPTLERVLIVHTSGNALSVYQKQMLLCILKNCAAKSTPPECYQKPTAQDPQPAATA